MRNLLIETRKDIERFGYKPEDITFIGSADGEYACTWDEFEKLADVHYDEDFGRQEVASDLIIRFDNGGLMVRHEYDGAERWQFHSSTRTPSPKPIVSLRVTSISWASTVAELQKEAK
ncbi:MAG: hypothetical protein ACYCU8_05940 [Ferrimicrobium acidiphilum]